MIESDWSRPFEKICDESGVELGAVLGKKKEKLFHLIHCASKALNGAQKNYTFTEKELLIMVYAFIKVRPYLLGTKVVVHINHLVLRYFMEKKNDKP